MAIKVLQTTGKVIPIRGKLCMSCKQKHEAKHPSGEKLVITYQRGEESTNVPVVPSPFGPPGLSSPTPPTSSPTPACPLPLPSICATSPVPDDSRQVSNNFVEEGIADITIKEEPEEESKEEEIASEDEEEDDSSEEEDESEEDIDGMFSDDSDDDRTWMPEEPKKDGGEKKSGKKKELEWKMKPRKRVSLVGDDLVKPPKAKKVKKIKKLKKKLLKIRTKGPLQKPFVPPPKMTKTELMKLERARRKEAKRVRKEERLREAMQKKKEAVDLAILKDEPNRLTCNYCNIAFLTFSEYSSHMKNSAEKHKEVIDSGKQFRCNECNEVFADVRERDKHKAETHDLPVKTEASNPAYCEICDVDFGLPSAFKGHTIRLHLERTINLYYCRECEATFECKVVHREHIKTHRNWSGSVPGLQVG